MQIDRRSFLGAGAMSLGALARPHASARLVQSADDPLGVRADFPAAALGVYLNSAYIAPTPTPVVEAGRAFVESKGRRPIPLGDMLQKTDEVRGQFARLVKARPSEIGFLFATSEGENIVARALDLKRGDNIVIDELHYDTTFVLYRHLEETTGVQLRIARARNGAAGVTEFEPLVDRRTRLVSVAWVSHQNGFRHAMRPLADLAHAHGAYLYTDAVQAAGMFPIDVETAGVDFLTTGTYKWLLGSYGVAPFYVREALLDRIPPDRFGALHVEKRLENHHYEIYRTAKKFDYATLAFGPVYQLGAALAYLERVGVDRIERHTVDLAARLWRGLADRGFRLTTPEGNRSSIVSFVNGTPADETRRTLEDAGVQVSLREEGRQIRVSPALFNTGEDVDRFLAVAERLVRPA